MSAADKSEPCPAAGVLPKRKSLAFKPLMPVMLKVIEPPAPNEPPKLNMMSYFPSQSGLKALSPVLTVTRETARLEPVWVKFNWLAFSAGFRLKYHCLTSSLPVKPGAAKVSCTEFAPLSLNTAVSHGVGPAGDTP